MVRVKIKFPFRIRRTLVVYIYYRNVIKEGTFEPCHLHLKMLSTCPTIMFFDLVISTATTTIEQLDMLITLGEGDKALKCLPY